MTALPPIPEATRLIPSLHNSLMSLYASLVLPAEQAASKAANAKHLMYSRVVGYLLLYPPNPTALAALKHDLASCNTADQGPLKAIYDLGEFYVKNFLLICKSRYMTCPLRVQSLTTKKLEGRERELLFFRILPLPPPLVSQIGRAHV